MFDKTAKFPNNALIRELRELWLKKNPSRKHKDLAKLLEVNSTALSAFCSQKELVPPRRCPDYIILRMLDILDSKIILSASSAEIATK